MNKKLKIEPFEKNLESLNRKFRYFKTLKPYSIDLSNNFITKLESTVSKFYKILTLCILYRVSRFQGI